MTKAISTNELNPSAIVAASSTAAAKPSASALSKSISCSVVADFSTNSACTLPKASSVHTYSCYDKPHGWYVTRKTYRSVAYRTWTVGSARKLLSSHSDLQLSNCITTPSDSEPSKDSSDCSFGEDKMTQSCIETTAGMKDYLVGKEPWRATVEIVDDNDLIMLPGDATKRYNCKTNGFFSHYSSMLRQARSGKPTFPAPHPARCTKLSLKPSTSSGSTISSNTSYDSMESIGDFYSADEYQRFQARQTAQPQNKLFPAISSNGFCSGYEATNGFYDNDDLKLANGLRKEASISSIQKVISHITGSRAAVTLRSPSSEGLLNGFLTLRRSFLSRLSKPSTQPISDRNCNGHAPMSNTSVLSRKLKTQSTSNLNMTVRNGHSISNGYLKHVATPKPELPRSSLTGVDCTVSNGHCIRQLAQPRRFSSYATAMEHLKQEMVLIRSRDFAILKQLCRASDELAMIRCQEGICAHQDDCDLRTGGCSLPPIPRCLQPATTTL